MHEHIHTLIRCDVLGFAWGASLICIGTTLSCVVIAHGEVEGTGEYTQDYGKDDNEPGYITPDDHPQGLEVSTRQSEGSKVQSCDSHLTSEAHDTCDIHAILSSNLPTHPT